MKKTSFAHPQGIYFSCSKCGLCCGDTTQKTRHIRLTERDAEKIANATAQPISKFADQTPEKTPYIYEMHKDKRSGKCIFLQNNQCTIYMQRPLICRFYPFQLTTAKDRTHVFEATDECPKISAQEGEELDESFFEALFRLACERLDSRS